MRKRTLIKPGVFVVDERKFKYGRLVPIDFVGSTKYRNAIWSCLCDCGNTINVPTSNLRSGNTKSCGCLNSELASARFSKLMKTKIGPLNSAWRGGVTPKVKIIRESKEYRDWRKSVFERDNYTCQHCGIRGNQTGGYLHADHIKPFALYPERIFDIDNGRTLCAPCHRKTDTYGYKTKILVCQKGH